MASSSTVGFRVGDGVGANRKGENVRSEQCLFIFGDQE